MFDIGFSELVLIAVVALVVIGPERLPKVARTVGLLFGRLQRYIAGLKADLYQELQLEEIKLSSEALRVSMLAAKEATEKSVQQITHSLHFDDSHAETAVLPQQPDTVLPTITRTDASDFESRQHAAVGQGIVEPIQVEPIQITSSLPDVEPQPVQAELLLVPRSAHLE